MAESISVVGSEITAAVIPLIAVTMLSASSAETALATTLSLLPFLVVGLPAGVWVDRMRRRPLLVACDVARALVLLTLPIEWALEALTLGHLYLVALVMGVGRVLFDVAHTSYLPRLVARHDLVEGNAKLYMSQAAGQVVGPGAVSLLLRVVSAPLMLILDVVSFVLSALLLLRIDRTEPQPTEAPGEAVGMRRQIGEGLRWVLTHRLLKPTTVCATIYNFGQGGLMSIFTFYGVRTLGLTASTVASILAVGAVGFALGTIAAPRVFKLLGLGPAATLAALLGVTGQLLLPLATPSSAVLILGSAWFITWFGPSIYGIAFVSLRQTVTPDELQGRQNATTRFLVWGAMSLGSLTVAAAAEAWGPRPAVLLMAVCSSFCLVPLVLSRDLQSLKELR